MKDSVFVFIYGYLPGIKYGGPVTSIYHFCEHFGDKYDIRIVCSNHDHGESEAYRNIEKGWNKVGKAWVQYCSEREYKAGKFYELMKPFNVKMVYLTGVFSYCLNHAAIQASQKLGIKVVIATRGEICKNILAMKRYKKIPYLCLMNITGEFNNIYFQVTSTEEKEQLKKYLHIDDARITMLPNIHGKAIDMPRPAKKAGEARMLFISRIHPKKNLLDAVKAAVNVKGTLIFDIYGPVEDSAYWQECQRVIESAPDNVIVTYCGRLDMNHARQCYYGYHGLIFPTLSENYGHVIVESMIAGCPVIITRGTTPWDDADNQAGYVVNLHDIDALTRAIERIIAMDEEELAGLQAKEAAYRDSKLQLQELLDGYERLIND